MNTMNFSDETVETIYTTAMNTMKEMFVQGYEASLKYNDNSFNDNARRGVEAMCVLTAKLIGEDYDYRELFSEAHMFICDYIRNAARERRLAKN